VLDLIGDRWTLLVVRDLACGKSHFGESCRSPERIATNILADRLGRLVEHGLAEKDTSDRYAGREVYGLTAKGETLVPVLEAIALWGLDHIDGTAALLGPISLFVKSE
jgi:DNA-binding HxlR family transcriptional regulator